MKSTQPSHTPSDEVSYHVALKLKSINKFLYSLKTFIFYGSYADNVVPLKIIKTVHHWQRKSMSKVGMKREKQQEQCHTNDYKSFEHSYKTKVCNK